MKNTIYRYRSFLTGVLAVCLCLSQLSLGVIAAPSVKAHSWYVKRNAENRQPECAGELAFIERYNGIYVDKAHGDDCEEKVIYLTFDAGYENGNIAKILDTLKSENVPGAFFVLENLINKNPDLIARMANEGHLVCNHTLRHKDMTTVHDKDSFAMELAALEKCCLEKTGVEIEKIFRYPEGKFSEESMQYASELGYKSVFWSFAYADWDNHRQPSSDAAKHKVLSNTHNGAIILLHPTSATNAEILPELIAEWRALGYSFGSLSEL